MTIRAACLALLLAAAPALAQPATIEGRVVSDMGLVFVEVDGRHMYEVGNEPWRAHLRAANKTRVRISGDVQPTGIPGHPMVGVMQVSALARDLRGRVALAGGAVTIEAALGQRLRIAGGGPFDAWLLARAGQEVDLRVEVTRPEPMGGEARVTGSYVEGVGRAGAAGGAASLALAGATLRVVDEPFRGLLAALAGSDVSARCLVADPGASDAVVVSLAARARADVTAHEGPSASSPELDDLARDAVVRVVGATGAAFEVELADRSRGFVRRGALALTPPPPAPASTPASTPGLVGSLPGSP